MKLLRLHEANCGHTELIVNMSLVEFMFAVEHGGQKNCTKIQFDVNNWAIVTESIDEIMEMLK